MKTPSDFGSFSQPDQTDEYESPENILRDENNSIRFVHRLVIGIICLMLTVDAIFWIAGYVIPALVILGLIVFTALKYLENKLRSIDR